VQPAALREQAPGADIKASFFFALGRPTSSGSYLTGAILHSTDATKRLCGSSPVEGKTVAL